MPIIIEPAFWGQPRRLVELSQSLFLDDNLVFSVHFYEPTLFMMKKKHGAANAVGYRLVL